jgi:two-component system sensor histidine kinase ArlS
MGIMTQKLLNKTLRVYILFSILVLVVTAPLFFFLTHYVQQEEADEMLMLRKHEFEKFNLSALKKTDIERWNLWNRDTRLEPLDTQMHADQFSNAYYPNIMDGDQEPYRVLRSKVEIEETPYLFVARINLLELEETIYSMGLFYLIIVLLLLSGLYVLTRKYSAWLWKPFMRTLEQLEAYDLRSPGKVDFPATNIDEFQRMNSVLEKLIQRNQAVYTTQKEFVENAAHELQTPLAVMRAKLDNFMQEDLSSRDAKALAALNDALERLTQLNKNMLLLSRIEYDAYVSREKVSVNALVSRQMDFLSEQLTGIQLELLLKETVELQANTSLLEICLSNLLVNAIRHNRENGIMQVIVENASVKIINTGSATALDKEQMFTRFSKRDPGQQGTGLGLAIVKRIVELNHWQIIYTFENNLHIFILKLH